MYFGMTSMYNAVIREIQSVPGHILAIKVEQLETATSILCVMKDSFDISSSCPSGWSSVELFKSISN